MRRFAILITALAVAMSALVVSQAHATGVPSNGKYLCTTGEASSSNSNPRFTITDGVVLGGNYCVDSVIIPAGVTGIGSFAFNEARLLTSITIPAGVTSIGDYAFFNAVSLTSITIPATVTSIGEYAFTSTTALNSIVVDSENITFSSIADVLFNKDATTLIRYPSGKSGTSYSIPSGITRIGSGAFSGSVSLTSITIPTGVTNIESNTFIYATKLSSINIPSSVRSIGDSAFAYASSLASVRIPSSVISIGEYAFDNATTLASVYFFGDQPSIGTNAFSNIASGPTAYITSTATGFTKTGTPLRWNGFTVETFNPNGKFLCTTGLPTTSTPNFTITDSVVTQGSNCAGSVVIPAGVTSIGDDAFAGANLLTSITIPSSVTSIGAGAFFGAAILSSVTIPTGVTSIGVDAFSFASSLTSITIPASVTSIGDSAFKSASSLASVYFLGNKPTSGINVFLNIAAGAKGYITSTATGFVAVGQTWDWLTVTANVANGTYLCTTGQPSSSIPNFTITSGVVTLGSNCVGSVVIPASVTSIGDNAFWGATSLTNITIPASVTSIGEYAFQGATSLTSITIPASVTSIGGRAFWGTTSLTSVTVQIGNPNYISDSGVLFNKLSTTLVSYPARKSGSSYSIPSSVTSIADTAFAFANSLTSITIPAGVTNIGSFAFEATTAMTSITIPAASTSIRDNAFLNASSLSSVYFLSSTAPVIGDYVFSGVAAGAKAYIAFGSTGFADVGQTWYGLTVTNYVTPDGTYDCNTGLQTSSNPNFTITDGVVHSGGSCRGSVVIPASVTSIGINAFSGSFAVTSITIPASVTRIEPYAFSGATALTTVTFGFNSQLSNIGEAAFEGANSLASITIPASVTSIGNYVFNDTTSLTAITVDSENNNFVSTDGVLFDKASTTLINYPAAKSGDSYSIPASVTRIGMNAFTYASRIINITIPPSVSSIGTSAFTSASSLANITISSNDLTIGEYAFYNLTSLKGIYFLGNAPTTVGDYAFYGAAGGAKAYVISTAKGFLKPKVKTWNGLTIATHAPDGTYLCTTGMPSSSTPNYRIIDGVVTLGSNCAGSVVIPAGVRIIGSNAFLGATSLSSVEFGSGNALVSIESNAFKGASSLTDIRQTLEMDNTASPTSVRTNKVSTTSVRATAVSTGINFPTSLVSIGDYAFSGATSLTSVTIPASVTSIGDSAFADATALVSVYFLGNKPTVGTNTFSNIASGAKAYVAPGATGFDALGTTSPLNGLIVEVVGATPTPVVDAPTPVTSTTAPVVNNSNTIIETATPAAPVVDDSAVRAAEADLVARTIGKKKSYVVKTLAKRVGIKIVSSKATVSLTVSKTSKKICVFAKSKLSTLKAGKCIVTFTVQEPTPKKGKKPKAKKTAKTLVVK